MARPLGARLPGIGSHHSARAQTDEWLTPPHVLHALGPFDLDPCSPENRPWPTAAEHFTMLDDGLRMPWTGRVWLNPPYSEIEMWMEAMARYGIGTALVFARVETRWWFDAIWSHASAVLFLKGRLTFHHGDGTASKAGHNSGGPSALVAYGSADASALAASGLPGVLLATPWRVTAP